MKHTELKYGYIKLEGKDFEELSKRAQQQRGMELREAWCPDKFNHPYIGGETIVWSLCKFNGFREFKQPKIHFGFDVRAYTSNETCATYDFLRGHIVSDFSVLVSKSGRKYYHFDGLIVATWEKHPAHETVKYARMHGGCTQSHLHDPPATHETVKYARMHGGYFGFLECGVLRRIGGDYKAPEGYRLASDRLGLKVVRESDGMDYHIECNFETLDWDFISFLMDENSVRRTLSGLDHEELKSVRVTLQDSKLAGNCITGSIAFAERHFNVRCEDILRAGYLFSVPATKLLRTKDARARRAAEIAWLRETTVCI